MKFYTSQEVDRQIESVDTGGADKSFTLVPEYSKLGSETASAITASQFGFIIYRLIQQGEYVATLTINGVAVAAYLEGSIQTSHGSREGVVPIGKGDRAAFVGSSQSRMRFLPAKIVAE